MGAQCCQNAPMGKAAARREVTALQHGRQVIQNLRSQRIRGVFSLNDMHPGEQYHQDTLLGKAGGGAAL